MSPLNEGDQALGLLPVLGPAGLFQLRSKGSQPTRAEGHARRFEGVGQQAQGVIILLLSGGPQLGDLHVRAAEIEANGLEMAAWIACATSRSVLLRPEPSCGGFRPCVFVRAWLR